MPEDLKGGRGQAGSDRKLWAEAQVGERQAVRWEEAAAACERLFAGPKS